MALSTTKTYSPLHQRRPQSKRLEISMAPMIDVVFLLLVFFLLTANFRSKEGFLPVNLPRQAAGNTVFIDFEPLILFLDSQSDGTCIAQFGQGQTLHIAPTQGVIDFALLGERLEKILIDQGRGPDDPIKLMPTRQTKWDHIVKAYDVLWRQNLHNVIFAMAE